MSDVFSEIDLSDNAAPTEFVESPANLRARRKNFSLASKHISNSPSPTNQINNTSIYRNNSFHDLLSPAPPPPLSILDSSSSSLSISFTTPTISTRYLPSPSSSPLPMGISTDSSSSSLSPKNLLRSAGSTDLIKRTFNFSISKQDSIIDSLLCAIYERDSSTYGLSSSQDSDTVTTGDFTDQSLNTRRLSDDSILNHDDVGFTKTNLTNKNIQDLRYLCSQLQQQISQANALLVKNLRHRDKSLSKLHRNCDIITAILQASSLKRREDTTMRFSLTPCSGEKGFQQWKDAISLAIRMPGGIPASIRQKLWISLAMHYIQEIHLDWDKTCRFAFNNCSNPDDDQLGIQIVKDLHRTGCSWSSNEHDRATLKRVLLAFARYNKSIGYCQGLNILAGVILDVVQMNEEYALMILIYLVDSILPNFFENNLRALAIDMAVFREWLRIYNTKLHSHLLKLQSASHDGSGTVYEPPLLNVFTIQWFLTLFATCLSRRAALRVWDALMIEGNEVLFRTGLVLWSRLSASVLKVSSADQFYSVMAQLSVQLLNEKIIDADTLIKEIYNFGAFPTPILPDLRQKFSFNITPFQQLATPAAAMSNSTEDSKSKRVVGRTNSDDMKSKENKRSKGKVNSANDDETNATAEEDMANFMSCFAVLSAPSRSNRLEYHANDSITSHNNNNHQTALSRLTPGAYSNLPTTHKTKTIEDSLSLDISQLRQQYKKLKERNKQVQVMIQASNEQKQRARAPSIYPSSPLSNADNFRRTTISSFECSSSKTPATVCSIAGGPLVNHLLIKPTDIKRNQFKRTVSLKSSSTSSPPSSTPVNDRQSKVDTPSTSTPSPQKVSQRSTEEEAAEAAELREEIDQLLTSLNLEKPSVPLPSIEPTEQLQEQQSQQQQMTIEENVHLETVARTLYDLEKTQVTTKEKKESPNLIERLLTSRSVQIPKYSSFNPFPSRSFNENVAVNGYKLGLYAPDPSNR
ncbi:unnamed protein product [Adineta ricciae]|uniref:Rab-GAP TBC domain-containing protein n=1 Tax=Adineta ricciae TaxID=249248 RepID=A0A813PMA8_ADIRI|nr:unnamed protein product [Adineta ricciae]CAF0845717.1 unnamed protein product [Adineta ricciae]